MSTQARDAFLLDLRVAEAATRAGVHATTQASTDRKWAEWTRFCRDLHQDPFLTSVRDPTILLQVFAQRVRDGRHSLSGRPVGHSTVSASLRAVGQTLALLGTPDPRLDPSGQVDIRLTRQIRSYKQRDPPPQRLQPIPLEVIKHAIARIFSDPHARESLRAAGDLISAAYYFLMRPGEYCNAPEAHPFRYQDVDFAHGTHRLNVATCSDQDLLSASCVVITYTDQKNANRGERVGQGRSGDPFFCPVLALARRIIHLRCNHAPLDTPIYAYYKSYWGTVLCTTSATDRKSVV